MAEPGAQELVDVNGVSICMQAFGNRADPAIVLIHGAGSSMVSWDEAFCRELAAGGRLVVRYDNRDCGRSTSYEVGAPPYAIRDLAADAIGVLDALGLSRAHLLGLSQGGSVALLAALDYPERVASLVLAASSPADGEDDEGLPPPSEELAASFGEQAPEPDWDDRDAVIEYLVEAERPLAGSSPGFDEVAMRQTCALIADHADAIAAQATNPFELETGEGWRRRLGELRAPTLILHGTDDPMFPPGHGQALEAEIPNARLIALAGLGHEYPPRAHWAAVVPEVISHTGG